MASVSAQIDRSRLTIDRIYMWTLFIIVIMQYGNMNSSPAVHSSSIDGFKTLSTCEQAKTIINATGGGINILRYCIKKF